MPRQTRSARATSTTTDASRHTRGARVVGREQISLVPASYVDPNGFLFEYGGDLARGIRGATSAFYRALFEDGTVERLCRDHGLVESWITDLTVPDHDADLGRNTGMFSLLAAERGARVIAIDSDETCIERLYRTAKDGRRSITALIADILCPTPAMGFMGREYPDLMARAKGDLVLCLGLMHHLHVNGRQSFGRIAAMLDELSTRQVVFEFVARDDPNVALLRSARAVDYDLAQVRAALGRHFSTIEALPSDRPTRTIMLCGK